MGNRSDAFDLIELPLALDLHAGDWRSGTGAALSRAR